MLVILGLLATIVMLALAVRDLLKGETNFGGVRIVRSTSPQWYWATVAFYGFCSVLLLWVSIRAAREANGCEQQSGNLCVVTIRAPS